MKRPVVTGAEVVKALQRGGFFVVRTRGSPVRLAFAADPTRRVTVPVPAGTPLKRAVLERMLEQAGWTVEDLRQHW